MPGISDVDVAGVPPSNVHRYVGASEELAVAVGVAVEPSHSVGTALMADTVGLAVTVIVCENGVEVQFPFEFAVVKVSV